MLKKIHDNIKNAYIGKGEKDTKLYQDFYLHYESLIKRCIEK